MQPLPSTPLGLYEGPEDDHENMKNNTAERPMDTPSTQELSKEPSKQPSDSELIRDYRDNKSSSAFESLVRRHYNTVNKRLLRLTQNQADADDLSQKLWIRVIENLSGYNERQKFPNFLNTIATNLLKDEWRKSGVRKQSSLDELLEESNGQALLSSDDDVSDTIANQHEISYLVKELIPNLAIKLRSVFLLRHESEYWDEKQPFQWQHLGELNKLTTEDVGRRFIHTRDSLINSNHNDKDISDEDRLIFLTWTQAQRQNKSDKQTETYLASLLGIPVNTFKTRYRAALAELSTGLEKWRKHTRSSN